MTCYHNVKRTQSTALEREHFDLHRIFLLCYKPFRYSHTFSPHLKTLNGYTVCLSSLWFAAFTTLQMSRRLVRVNYRKDFWDRYWRHARQLLAHFSPVPSNLVSFAAVFRFVTQRFCVTSLKTAAKETTSNRPRSLCKS